MTEIIDLERLRLGMRTIIEEELLAAQMPGVDITFEVARDFGRRLVFTVRGGVPAHKAGEKFAEWPADWWQAFKQRWFPVWLLRRYSVRMKDARFELWDVVPTLKLPKHQTWRVIVKDYQGVVKAENV